MPSTWQSPRSPKSDQATTPSNTVGTRQSKRNLRQLWLYESLKLLRMTAKRPSSSRPLIIIIIIIIIRMVMIRWSHQMQSQSFHSTCLIRLSIIIIVTIMIVVIIHTKYMIQPTTTNFQFWFEIMIRTFFTLFFPSTTTILTIIIIITRHLIYILLIHSNLKLDWNN